MKKITKLTLGLLLVVSGLVVTLSSVYAAGIGVDSLAASKTGIGSITSLQKAFVFAFNLFRYLGWAGVIVGIGLAIFSLIYKLFNEDNENVMKTVQGYITKAVIIVLAGFLLLSAGFIVTFLRDLLGITTGPGFEVESELGA